MQSLGQKTNCSCMEMMFDGHFIGKNIYSFHKKGKRWIIKKLSQIFLKVLTLQECTDFFSECFLPLYRSSLLTSKQEKHWIHNFGEMRLKLVSLLQNKLRTWLSFGPCSWFVLVSLKLIWKTLSLSFIMDLHDEWI